MPKKKTSTRSSAAAPAPRRPKSAPAASRASRASGGSGGGVPTAADRIVLLHGPEAHLKSLHTEGLRKALTDAHGEIDVIRFDATAPAADVLDECRSFGLMQRHRLVIVDDAEDFVKEGSRPLLERYAATPAEQSTLLLRAGTWHKGKLDALIQKVGSIIKCEAPIPEQAIKWAAHRAQKEHGAALEPAAAELLVARLGPDLGRIDSELAKLAAGTEKNGTITPNSVRELVGFTREDEAWPLQAVAVTGDAAATLAAIAALKGPSRQDPTFLLYVLADGVRKLHILSNLLHSGANSWQALGAARIWGSQQDKERLVAAAKRASPEKLAELLAEATDANARVRSGFSDSALAVETLAVRFASALR